MRFTTDQWEQLGHSGEHEDHHLHADEMQDIWCYECGRYLTDEEEESAWPTDED